MEVVHLLVVEVLVQVRSGLLGQVQDALEVDFALRLEVGPRQRLLLAVAHQRLVEVLVLLVRDLALVARPDGLLRVHQLPVPHGLLLRARLRLVALRLLLLGLLRTALLLQILALEHVLLLFLLHGHLHRLRVALVQVDGERDELRVLLDQALQLVRVQVLLRVVLQEQRDLRSSAQRVALGILAHLERRVRARLPDVLHRVLVALRPHDHAIRHQIHRVEAHAELTDHVQIRACSHLLHELRGARLRHGAQVLDQLLLGHAHATISDRQGARLLVELHADVQVIHRIVAQGLRHVRQPQQQSVNQTALSRTVSSYGQRARRVRQHKAVPGELCPHNCRSSSSHSNQHPTYLLVRQRQETNLVKSISRIGNHLTKEHVLVLVQRVDDDIH